MASGLAERLPAIAQVRRAGRPAAISCCFSRQAMGNGLIRTMADIVYVRPETFDPKNTEAIARSITAVNQRLRADRRPYLLMGFGRWGSFDRWLGIPVKWRDIDAVGAMIEIRNTQRLPPQGADAVVQLHHAVGVNPVPTLVLPFWREARPDMHAGGTEPDEERLVLFMCPLDKGNGSIGEFIVGEFESRQHRNLLNLIFVE